MKIAIWIYRLGKGGAERVMASLANSFARRGHEVILYVHGSHNNIYADELDETVQLRVLPRTIPWLSRPRKLVYMITLTRILKREPHDILFTTILNHNVTAALFKKLFRIPVSLVLRESNTLSVQTDHATKRSKKRLFIYAKYLYSKADAIIAPSRGVADDLIQTIPAINNHVQVIPNPLDIDSIKVRKEEALPDNRSLAARPFIMGAGRLLPQKGFDVLIRAWAQIAEAHDIDLLLLGEGAEEERLRTLAESYGLGARLHMPGFDANPYRYMARAEAFVLSSYHEGLPNVLLQAMACGCPLVATDCPSGPREILDDGTYGTLVPVGDADALADAIATTLDAPPDSETLTAQARYYDIDAVSARYLTCFKDVVSQNMKT